MNLVMMAATAATLQVSTSDDVTVPLRPPSIEAVTIHAFVDAMYTCSEHPAGQLASIGDSLGTDCSVVDTVEKRTSPAREFMRPYRTDGMRNEDWFGWGLPVLAPFDGKIAKVHDNPAVNAPGALGKPPASMIIFAREDGVHVLYAHVTAIAVKAGDVVKAGQAVAKIGNNGPSWSPHVHIGAWKGAVPMQIRFDLTSMGERAY